MIKFGIVLGLPELAKNAQLAEQYGFDSIWFSDISMSGEVFGMAAYAASKTKKVKIGIISNPYTRNPVVIAAAMATLDVISVNRAVVALGFGGYHTLLPLGFKTWEKPISTCRDAVQVMKRLFRGEDVTYEGKNCKYSNVQLKFKTRAELPIHLAVMTGPHMMEMVGKIANGVLFAGPLGFEYTKLCINKVVKAAEEAGRDPKELEISLNAICSFSRDKKEAIENAKISVAKRIISDPRFYNAVKFNGITDGYIDQVKKAIPIGKERILEIITDDMVDTFSIAGTTDTCARKIQRYNDLGITSIIPVLPQEADVEDVMRIIAEEIIPRV